jgi:hypothetical protein
MNWLDWTLITFTLAAIIGLATVLVDRRRNTAAADAALKAAHESTQHAWEMYADADMRLAQHQRTINTLRRELRVLRGWPNMEALKAARDLIGQDVFIQHATGEFSLGHLEGVTYTNSSGEVRLELLPYVGTDRVITDAVRVTKWGPERLQPAPTPPKRCKARLTPGDSPLVLKTVRCELHRGHTEKHRADGVPIDRLAGATTSNWITWITWTNNFHH